MTNLTAFPSPTGIELRTLLRDGEPWFIAKDVCDALDVRTNNLRAILNDNELATAKDCAVVICQPGRSPLLVNESGFYKLVLKSRKPEARKFQDWVTGTVLPSLRKDGGYIVGEEEVVTGEMTDDELLARALQVATKKLERLTLERDAANAKVVQVEARSAQLSARAKGLEPADEVTRYRSLEETAEWLKAPPTHSMRGLLS